MSEVQVLVLKYFSKYLYLIEKIICMILKSSCTQVPYIIFDPKDHIKQ